VTHPAISTDAAAAADAATCFSRVFTLLLCRFFRAQRNVFQKGQDTDKDRHNTNHIHIYTVSHKLGHRVFVLTSPNIDRFPIFFHLAHSMKHL